jgi:hypothetical protein
MPWTFYEAPPTHSIDDVVKALQAQMNAIANTGEHGPRLAATAKVVTSNQRDGDARGVVYFFAGEGGVPMISPGGTGWQNRTFFTNTEYVRELYLPTVELLNTMPAEQAVNAHATMTNMKEGDATMTLWWPTKVD